MLLIIVHRLLQSFILPPLNAIIFILLGLILDFLHKKIARSLILIGLLLLYIQSIPIFAYHLSTWMESPPITQEQIKNSQAIIVLGGGIKNTGYEYPVGAVSNTSTLVRLKYAAFLAKQNPHKLVITSGGYSGNKYTEASVMRDTLKNTFDISNKILIESKSRNTDENAQFVANMLKPMHITNVVIVSQAYHTKRATALFKKYGLNAIAAPTDYYNNLDALTPQLAFIPNANAMATTSRVLHEIFGYLFYISM